MKTCCGCGVRFIGTTSRARYCSKDCYQRAYRRANPYRVQDWRRRRQRRMQALRPRCVVCSGPIPYGKNGVRLDARTCGRRYCALTAHRWFGPMKPRSSRGSSVGRPHVASPIPAQLELRRLAVGLNSEIGHGLTPTNESREDDTVAA